MKKNIWIGAAGIAVLAPALMALPGHSAAQAQDSGPVVAVSPQGQESGRTALRRIEISQDPETITISDGDEGGPVDPAQLILRIGRARCTSAMQSFTSCASCSPLAQS